MGSAIPQLHTSQNPVMIHSTMESLNPDPVGANVTMTSDNKIEIPDWLDPAPRTLAKSPPAVKSLVLAQYEHVFMRVIDEVAHGKSLSQVLNDDQRHIDYNDFYRWIKKDPTRKQLFDEAQEMRTEFMAGEIIEIADADDTLEDVNRSRLKIDTRKWLMGAHNRKKYGATTNIEMTGGISILAAIEAANARVIDLADVTDVESK
jgi:hypothetical protein